MNDRPADYAKDGGDGISHNTAPTANAKAFINFFDRTPAWVYLLISVLAAAMAVAMWLDTRRMQADFDRIRVLLEGAQRAAVDAVRDAALSSERADKAERSAALNREYAVQVVGQLNRMGFPVMSPGEVGHPPALPEDYAKLDAFIEQRNKEQRTLPTP